MERPINRIAPLHDVQAYQTYSIAQPPDVLVRAACERVGCAAWLGGWETAVDESAPLGAQQAAYIRGKAGRTCREQRAAAGLTVFRLASGERCFREHQPGPERYAGRDGDWRGNPTAPARQHIRPIDWVEDFGEHQQRIADQQQKG